MEGYFRDSTIIWMSPSRIRKRMLILGETLTSDIASLFSDARKSRMNKYERSKCCSSSTFHQARQVFYAMHRTDIH